MKYSHKKIAILICGTTLAGCNGGSNTPSAPAAVPSTSVKVSMLQDKVVAKNGTTTLVPITFATLKPGDSATNLKVEARSGNNIQLENHCPGGSISSGNRCNYFLRYTGNNDSGILPVRYSYTNSHGQSETGAMNIPYVSSNTNVLQVHNYTPGMIRARKNRNVPFTLYVNAADNHCPISKLSLQSLDRGEEVKLGNTFDGKDGPLYSSVTGKRLPVSLSLFPKAGTAFGTHQAHLRFNYETSDCSGSVSGTSGKNSKITSKAATTTTSQDVTLDYSVESSAVTVIPTVSPGSDIATQIGESTVLTISFATNTFQVSNLTVPNLTVTPKSAANSWSVGNNTTPCALVTKSSTGCTIQTVYQPQQDVESGVLELSYGYNQVDDTGKSIGAENNVVVVDFSTNSANTVIAAPTNVVTTNAGSTSNFNVTFSTNFGTVSNLQLTGISGNGFENNQSITSASSNNNGVTYIASSDPAMSAGCSTVDNSGKCVMSFSYSPPSPAGNDPGNVGTSMLVNYTYTDSNGQQQSGSLNVNLLPVYSMVIVTSGNYWNFNLYNASMDSSSLPNFGGSAVSLGIIGSSGTLYSLAPLPNLPSNTAYTGSQYYNGENGENLYISSIYANFYGLNYTAFGGEQYGNGYIYNLAVPDTQQVSPLYQLNGPTTGYSSYALVGFNGVAILAGPNSIMGPSVAFLTSTYWQIGLAGIGAGGVADALNICPLGGDLTCMSGATAVPVQSYQTGQSEGSIMWGWTTPQGYVVDESGSNIYFGGNYAESPRIGINNGIATLYKCSVGQSSTTCNPLHQLIASEPSNSNNGPWITAVTVYGNTVSFGTSNGEIYSCNTNDQNCNLVPNGASSSSTAINTLVYDNQGNLYGGDSIGHEWVVVNANGSLNGTVFFTTINGAAITASNYSSTNNTLFIGDANGVVYSCLLSTINTSQSGQTCSATYPILPDGIATGIPQVTSITTAILN